MDAELKAWREQQKHLPEFMRDFHRCKQLFRGISEYIVCEADHPANDVNWRQAHCYTIDVFLWFMAKHGFSLQRCRVRKNFEDLDALLEQLDAERRNSFALALGHGGGKEAGERLEDASGKHGSEGLSGQSPACLGGLEVVAEVVWYDPELHGQTGDGCKIVDYSPSDLEHIPVGGKLYALPIDPQAIIDGVLGEAESRVEAALAADRAVRHQQARQIDELQRLLRMVSSRGLTPVLTEDELQQIQGALAGVSPAVGE